MEMTDLFCRYRMVTLKIIILLTVKNESLLSGRCVFVSYPHVMGISVTYSCIIMHILKIEQTHFLQEVLVLY